MLSDGDPNSKVFVVGESPGNEDIRLGRAFSGFDGLELDRLGNEAAINFRRETFLFNVADSPVKPFYTAKEAKPLGIGKVDGKYPHPDILAGRERLRELVWQKKPNLVILLGAPALWALTSLDGIGKWRGSVLDWNGIKVIPTYNPAMLRKQFPLRWQMVQDFRRCYREMKYPEIRYPEWNFIIRPSFEAAMDFLSSIHPGDICCADSETRGGQIACWGIAKNRLDAICIPFMQIGKDSSYWSEEEEIAILIKIAEISTNPEIGWIFQNGLYDAQYTAKCWGFAPNIIHDTMIMQHVCYAGLPKRLDFIASITCDHYRYWKDEGKEWNASIPEDEYWYYNCEDTVYTYECYEKLLNAISVYKLEAPYEFQIKKRFWTAFYMMLRGCRIDTEYKNELTGNLIRAQQSRGEWLETVLDHEFNPDSNKQMKALFYEDLNCAKVFKGRGEDKRVTCDDDALETLKGKYPLFIPLIEVIQESRSIRVFKSNFAESLLDSDDRMRCSFNITGTTTYRYSSSKSIWNTGANLQTIPVGTEDD